VICPVIFTRDLSALKEVAGGLGGEEDHVVGGGGGYRSDGTDDEAAAGTNGGGRDLTDTCSVIAIPKLSRRVLSYHLPTNRIYTFCFTSYPFPFCKPHGSTPKPTSVTNLRNFSSPTESAHNPHR
jgi:hypothetical protein